MQSNRLVGVGVGVKVDSVYKKKCVHEKNKYLFLEYADRAVSPVNCQSHSAI
jgi:hypothetical protein